MAQIRINRDGSVETMLATQDIGGGARTVCAIITSRCFGHLALERIRVRIGDSDYPASGASAGSSTTGGVTREIERAADTARQQLLELAAGKLKAEAGRLEIRDGGVIGVQGKPGGLSWEEATSLIKDSIIGHADTLVEPGYQWAVCRDGGEVEQANEENYRA